MIQINHVLLLQVLCLLFPSFEKSTNLAQGDALHPIRYDTEELFFRAKTHERSFTADEMESKISTMRKRRNFQAWDESNPEVKNLMDSFNGTHHGGKRPNILLILADDLGYGDLSVKPFVTDFDPMLWPCVEGGILTPQLERMARQGVIMTNFHASAPVCSPARTSIMTGLYPWRMTAMNAFELGRDLSQRNGFLPQIPTTPEILREYGGYYTVHSGKWHLGGMREEQRKDRVYKDDCSRPSPNQHGFEEYISELDGPESPRYTFLLRNANLHTQGYRHLLKDDVPMPIVENKQEKEQVLSDREADDAILYMKEQQKLRPNQPWFMQVWFNAPHGKKFKLSIIFI
jgi:arylsulfatase A-like enzyme